jgi:hypothetical protein
MSSTVDVTVAAKASPSSGNGPPQGPVRSATHCGREHCGRLGAMQCDCYPAAKKEAEKEAARSAMREKAAKSVMKKPAAIMMSVMKKQASKNVMKKHTAYCRPHPEHPKEIEYYNNGTIYTSELKQGYRVMMPGERRIDKLFVWRAFDSKAACLKHIKEEIDECEACR